MRGTDSVALAAGCSGVRLEIEVAPVALLVLLAGADQSRARDGGLPARIVESPCPGVARGAEMHRAAGAVSPS